MDLPGFKLPRESPDAAFAKEQFPRQVFTLTPQRHKTHALTQAQRPAVNNDTTTGRPPHAHPYRTAESRHPRLKTPLTPGIFGQLSTTQSVNVLRGPVLGCFDKEQTRFAGGCTLLLVLFDSGRILMSSKQSPIHAFASHL